MSNSKDKGLQDRLKNFFRGLKTGTHVPRSRSEEFITLTEDLCNDLKAEAPLATRLKTVKEINDVAKVRRLEAFSTEKLWTLLEDLLKPDVARETRHTIISFFASLCQSQTDKNGFLRAKFFHFIKTHNIAEDVGPQYEFLKALTDNGRDVSYFNEQIGPLILSWMGENYGRFKTGEFMIFLNNFIKFNQSFVDQEILQGIIQNVCFIACASQARQDTLECLHVLESVISYGSLPPCSLKTFLATLCRTVNVDYLCQTSWKTARNLLGTHLGHSALLTMCQFMETSDSSIEYAIVRGAVFFAGVSVWGSKVVRSLKYSPSTILSSFAAALERKHLYISYEVMVRIYDLVKCNGDTLQSITWDLVLEIIETIVEDLQLSEWKSDSVNYPKILSTMNDTLDVTENMVDNGGFCGALHRFYNVIETSSRYRSEASIEKLLMYKHKHYLLPTMPNWLNHLIVFCERHLREETRRVLKVKAIDVINQVGMVQIQTYEDDLIEKIILHYFKGLDTEPDLLVRHAGVQFIVQFLMESNSKKSHDVVSILERIVNRVYENPSNDNIILREIDAIDISTAINGLIQLFQKKIYQLPSSIAISCYKILVRHLSYHYKKISILDHCGSIRYNIFSCFFKIRANSLYHLGFPTSSSTNTLVDGNNQVGSVKIRFSPYLAVDHRDGERPDTTKVDQANINQGDAVMSHQPLSSNQSLFHTISTSNLVSSSSSSTSSLASTTTLTNFQYPSSGGGGQQSFQNMSPSINSNHNGSSSVGSGSGGASVIVMNPGQSHSTATPATPLLPVVTSISLTLACKLVVTCLKKEKDWKILELVLQQIPHVLENKALILSKHGNDIDYLATALCTMVTDKSPLFIDSLRNAPPKFPRSEFQPYIFPILTSLVSYYSHLESSVQVKIVKCLELGLVTKCSRMCILALSMCALEMKDIMHKLVPEVLLSLSKITPKVNIAIPVLEFLSTLIHLPRIFASFVQDQYMSIFAIALPYTNPFKFNQYTVSLAHHVIAMWFLKCRLSFRRGFVSYIIKGLEANVWAPFEEESRKNALELHNEDSSNRKRSSSLTEQTFKRRERPISGHTGGPHQSQLHSNRFQAHILENLKPPMDKSLTTFHQELTETCVDLMARYAFADCSALPTRFQSTNFLLCGGHSQTQSWLTDNRIITITTSGCTQKELRDGLCDNCWRLCRKYMPVNTGEQASGGENSENHAHHLTTFTGSGSNIERSLRNPLLENASLQRRRHRSAFAGTSPGKSSRPDNFDDTIMSSDKAKDDLHLDNKISSDFDERSIFSHNSELSLKTKSDHSYCTCWCQGWAEVHIRRPTGNTSWMMRVQNQLGNHSTIEFPIKELSAMYMNTLFTSSLKPISPPVQSNVSTTSSNQSSPTHQKQLPVQTTVVNNDGSQQQQNSKSPSSPSSPQSPGTPTEEFPGDINGGGRKNPVRRSNSSPEMCSSWKKHHMNHQREIEEQDEEELQSNIGTCDPSNENEHGDKTVQNVQQQHSNVTSTSASAATTLSSTVTTQLTMGPVVSSTSDTADAVDGKAKGSVSPFQCYDPIPEKDEDLHHTPTNTTLTVPKNDVGVVEDLTPLRRDRMSTISVMSPARRNHQGLRRMMSQESSLPKSSGSSSSETGIRSGISPGFIFLQLCAQGAFGTGTSKPLQLPLNEQNQKSLKVLDFIPPYETHKIGVVYVGPGEASNETKILQNQYGSSRYREFLNGLGKLIKLSEVDPQKTFLAGLSRDGIDGEFATIWQDDVMQVIFHVATLMPSRPSDPAGNYKKCHIGNDFVAIVYNNSDEEYDISTIKGQFLYACVVIQPLDHKTNRVIVKAKPILAEHIGHTEPKIVSDQNLPIMARQWALHSNLASVIFQSMQRSGADPYASNWLERLRHIKRLKARISQDVISTVQPHTASDESGDSASTRRPFSVDDFTDFV